MGLCGEQIAASAAPRSSDDFARAKSPRPIGHSDDHTNEGQGERSMPKRNLHLTRRGVLVMGAASLMSSRAPAAEEPLVTVHRDPSCGCCSGWVQHLQSAGFPTTIVDSQDLDAVKARLGVPDDLIACHTAEVAGYVIEGHVPA